ncbi:serine/threonine protein kinase [Myxococcus sp. Y35]|uniref:serine/threonine protein kinase n=1 Tax=Pseudomyxococcus flavus TaxID=3115648 RepID=UPI003CEDFB91
MARPVEPAPLEGPVRFGPYTLVRRIGAGGMGEVFLAREEAPRRACVVKKVLPQLMASPQFAGRFRDEARVVVRLHHPNIARVYAMGEVEGQLYLSMEYVQGKTLSRLTYRLRQLGRTLPLGIMLLLGQRLCEGLAYAHDATDESGHPLHLVHRDLSPANVCISYAGEVKIIDFGAAQSTLKEQQTAPRVVIGNLTYMAPEQARKRFVDRRADVYAVGALLWELFAWKPLAQRGDPVERWRRAAYPQWEPAGHFRQGVPSSVDAFLMRALASEPDNRFPDAGAMGAELARLKAKLAPNVTDADLARLISGAFPREKKAEELVLRELLREERSRSLTEPEVAAVLVPPTALAFEHGGIEAPEDFVPGERADASPAVVTSEDGARPRPAAQDDPAEAMGVTARGPDARTQAASGASRGAHATRLYGTEDEATVVDAGASRGHRSHASGERADAAEARGGVSGGGSGAAPPEQGSSASSYGDEDEESTVVQPGRGGAARAHRASDERAAVAQAGRGGAVSSHGDGGSEESTVVQPGRGGAASAHGDGGSEESTVVQPRRSGGAVSPSESMHAQPEPAGTPRRGTSSVGASTTHATSDARGGAVDQSAQVGAGDTAATEAVDAAKLMVALERAEAARAPSRGAAASEDVTVTEVSPARAQPPAAPLRRATRETQVGFGVDISQAVDAAAVEARRLELVRAITGDDEVPVMEAESPSGTWLRGRRAWLAAGLFTGACALGLALAWALA